MSQSLESLLTRFSDTAVLVLGDLILDEWIWGRVSRISPEAPIPVVDIDSVTYSPGGASNVASNLAALGGAPVLFGVVGDDHEAGILAEELARRGIDQAGLIVDRGRPTTRKTRIIAHHQQVVRADRERRDPIDDERLDELLSRCSDALDRVAGVLISDYGKGVTTAKFLKSLIERARERSVPIVVDPKGTDFSKYRGASCITPNQFEASAATRIDVVDQASLEAAGSKLLAELRCEVVLITRGEQGMAVFEPGKPMLELPALAHEVYDVTGAGDTVVATLALARAAGASWPDAACLANPAASVVVAKVGTAICTTAEIQASLDRLG